MDCALIQRNLKEIYTKKIESRFFAMKLFSFFRIFIAGLQKDLAINKYLGKKTIYFLRLIA